MMKAEDLKNSILQMAMQGKLVPQDPNDEPATTLLEKIKQEKEQLIKDKVIKRNKNESTIYKKDGHWYEVIDRNNEVKCIDEEIPFEIPETWIWARLNAICTKITDGSHNPPPKKEKGFPVLSVKNIYQDKLSFDSVYRYCDKEGFEKENKRTNIKKGDLLLGIVGSIGSVAIYNSSEKVIAQRSLSVINSLINQIYLKYIFKTQYFNEFVKDNSKGTAQKGLYLNSLKKLLIPIPPLNEQKRIVQKLEQILPQITQYQKYEEQLTNLNNKLPTKLKKSILQQAIQGKLTQQNPEDEPASKLLEKIKEEKEQLIKEGKIKRNKNESTIYKKDGHWYEVIDMNNEVKCIDEETQYDLPENWIWVRLNTITNIVMGQSPKGEFVHENNNGIEFHQGKIFFGDKYLKKSNKSTSKPSKFSENNSLLLCVRAPVGKINLCNRKICIGRGLCSIKPFNGILLEYIYIILLTYEDYYNNLATGSTFKAIKKEIVENTLIPLAPAEEQEKITNKVKKLIKKITQ